MLFCDGPLARGERFFANPWTHAYVTKAPRQGREELLQPLPGCESLFVFNPGVRFAHPRLISLRPVGAEYVTVLETERDSHATQSLSTPLQSITSASVASMPGSTAR